MFLAFRAAEAKDWRSQVAIALDHSGSHHKLQFHHIFPKAVLKSDYSESTYRTSGGNGSYFSRTSGTPATPAVFEVTLALCQGFLYFAARVMHETFANFSTNGNW
jgi:hypothetical protein